jgi:rhamnose transport system permease protein
MIKQRQSVLKRIIAYQNFGLVIGFVGLLIVAAIITPQMYSFFSITNMLRNNAAFALLAIGMMFVIITGGIDLSVASTMSLGGVTTVLMMNEFPYTPAVTWLFLGIMIGTLCGAINGILVGYLKMIPMIATLGTMYVFRGLAFVVSGGQWWFPHQFTQEFANLSVGRTFGIFNVLWIVLLVIILAVVFLGYTAPGRRIYAVGTNRESAKIAGIKEERTVFMAFTLCGALAGMAGMLYTATYSIANSNMGMGFEMQTIAICILGGVSIAGGRGRVDGVVIGFLMMSVITYFISMLPGLSVWQNAIQGSIILIAVALNIFVTRSGSRRALRERGALI